MLRRISFWLYLLFAGCLLIASFMVSHVLQESRHLTTVVVATKNIAPYSQITPSEVKTIQIPELGVPKNSYHSYNGLIGLYASENIPAGVQLLTNMFYSHASTTGELIHVMGKPGDVYVSIPVATNDIAGDLTPGEHVILSVASQSNNINVPATLLSISQGPLLKVLMNQSDYSEIEGSLSNIRIELPYNN